MNELDKAFQEAMKKYQFTAYSGRIYMDMKTMFTEGWDLANKEQDFGQVPKEGLDIMKKDYKQLELF